MNVNHPLGSLPSPGEGEAHVWIALLSESTAQLARYNSLISPEEMQRAIRFIRTEDRDRHIATHGILRELLGRYLAADPAKLAFTTNPFGKPGLAQRDGKKMLSFNLTHSGNVILYVVAGSRQVGVDVELIRTDFDVMDLAQGQFSSAEVKALQATCPNERSAAFFRCWTRKEAYIKARGEGLGFPLKEFSVSLGDNESPAILWASDDPAVQERWSMFNLVPAPGHAGAVAVEGRPVQLVTRKWTAA